ncbi:MAG: hypothetical protein WC804_11870 [Sphingomonas sp.]|jgi:hypothetical protein|uniref:hypothetical protein n=1 Tax=Sphingomonas sp. TaxID=28214 RepID=UPI0035645BC5
MILDSAATRILNGATSQDDRVAGAPAPDEVAVDGRSLAQLIAFAVRYGALVNFYDLQDCSQGDWVPFFATDRSVILATHAALDLTSIERDLQRQLARAQRDPWRLDGVITVLARLLAILDQSAIPPADGEAHLRHPDIHRRDDALGDPLRRLDRHLGGDALEQALERHRAARDSRWHDSLFEILDDLAVTLIAALRRGHLAAIAALEVSLDTDGHAPQAALWNSFAKLFSEARTELNSFPRRLVDFYYSDVLRQRGLSAQPDQLFLTFTPAQPTDQASVPRGAQFPAGTDAAGAAINYAADTALEVTPAKVIGLSVHRIAKPGIGDFAAGDVSPTVLSGEVVLDPDAPETLKPFPMFGGALGAENGSLEMKPAKLGFSISSPVLMLVGGVRTIEIGLVIVTRDFTDADDDASAPQPDATWQPPGQDARLLNLAELVALSLRQTFAFYYSTAGGWIEIDGFAVTAQLAQTIDDRSRFVISFTLPADAPPLVATETKLVGDPPPGLLPIDNFPDPLQAPTVIGNLRADASSSPAALQLAAIKQAPALQRLEIGAVEIAVFVEGLTGVKLTTPTGQADTSRNFAVFGLPPTRDSALDITAPELFVKAIDTLSVVINWAGLPVTSTGFKGYYQDYVLDADGNVSPSPLFDNRSFRATFSLVNPGPWLVDRSAPSQALFATEPLVLTTAGATLPGFMMPAATRPSAPPPPPEPDPAAPLASDVRLRVPIAPPVDGVPAYYNPATSALRLTLAAPAYAFGNILYTSNLMAASTALGQTSVAGLAGGSDGKRSTGALRDLSRTNAEAPESGYLATLAPAVDTALSAMTGEALVAVKQAIANGGAPADAQASLLADLEAALGDVTTHAGTLWQRLARRGATPGQAATVLSNLVAWLAANEHAFGAGAKAPLDQAHGILDMATTIATSHAAAADQPVAVARPNIAAAVQVALAGLTALLPPSMPNPPWLPMASGLAVNYTASGRYEIAPTPTPTPSRANSRLPGSREQWAALASTDATPPTPSETVTFMHVEPFDKAKAPVTTGWVGLLPAVERHDALYIQLSQPVPQVALLFILAADSDGWWSNPPATEWAQHADGAWQRITVLGDGTNRLSNSGIITIQLLPDQPPDKPIRLRVLACGDTSNAPLVKAVIANALTASWVGPGGADALGIPLPAKTISKTSTSLTNIGTIDQPMQSFGGRPPATGSAFQMWMAERLRHKGYGITGWDYQRLVLEAEPSLWQVAVVPAVDGFTGLAAPGKVWVVAVAGPNTPNVVDPTVPLVDLTTLSNIGDRLEKCVGPFVTLAVTNPPYLRLRVTAECHFSDGDTPDYWSIRLKADLTKWLSPWPDEALGPRPANYYTRRAIADFVRHRPYVLGVASLEVAPEVDEAGLGWYFLTSSLTHVVTPILPASPAPGHHRPHVTPGPA